MVEPWWCEKQLAYANKIERGAKEPEWKRWKPQVAVDGDGRPWTSEFWEKQAVYAYRWHLENHCVGRDAFDVDHVLPVSIGGSYFEMSNLQILCFPDHVRKTREDGSRMVGRKKSRNPKES
jgi:hypothetical protein